MIWWKRRTRKPLIHEQVEAIIARAQRANAEIDRRLAEMKKSQDGLNNQNGPGGPDSSAGAIRVK